MLFSWRSAYPVARNTYQNEILTRFPDAGFAGTPGLALTSALQGARVLHGASAVKYEERALDRVAMLQLIAGATLLSFAPVFVRLLSVPPTTSAFYRTLIGGGILLALVFARREPLRMRRTVFWVLLAAGFFFALDLAFWHRSINYLGPGLATLLANFQVFVLAIAGVVVFKEKLRLQLVFGVALALVGLAMIVGLDWATLDARYRAGVVLGLLTAVCFGSYVLALRRARIGTGPRKASPIVDVAVASLASAGFLFVFAAWNSESLVLPGMREAGLLVAYALVAQVFGWVLISASLARLPASRVGLVLLIEPTLAYVWDVLFFAKPVGATEAAGAALALLAIYLGSRSRVS